MIFQILAVENLGLSPAAIGTAFGLGLISLPFQLLAGRIPLRLAKRNVQIFLVLAAIRLWQDLRRAPGYAISGCTDGTEVPVE